MKAAEKSDLCFVTPLGLALLQTTILPPAGLEWRATGVIGQFGLPWVFEAIETKGARAGRPASAQGAARDGLPPHGQLGQDHFR
jgi:hypothetical protein